MKVESSTRPHPLQMADVKDDNRGKICYFDPFEQAKEDERQRTRNPQKEKQPEKDSKRQKDAGPQHDQDIFLEELYRDEDAQALGLSGVAPRINKPLLDEISRHVLPFHTAKFDR